MTQISTKDNLRLFFKESWPLPTDRSISKDEIAKIDRLIWYCNISGNPIPELQCFNKSNMHLTYPIKKKCLSEQLYHEGATSYRVYGCGHAFLDIHVLCAIFDHSAYRSESLRKELVSTLSKGCLICSNVRTSSEDKGNVYGVSGSYVGGTVHIKTTIPKKMLPYLKGLWDEGQVIDTDGYRGIGLYILEAGEFVKVELGEYYPIWTVNRAKKFGYRRLLRGCMWGNDPEFDKIELECDVVIYHYEGFFYQNKAIKVDNSDTFGYLLKGKDCEKGFYIIDLPLKEAREYRAYFSLPVSLKIKVSDFDYLVVDRTIDKPKIYFTDLNGNNKMSV